MQSCFHVVAYVFLLIWCKRNINGIASNGGNARMYSYVPTFVNHFDRP
jgi:hypothetical protein